MQRLVQTLALAAALVALAFGIWREYAVLAVLRRTVIAYLAAYFLGGLVSIACRFAVGALREPEPVPDPAEDKRARKKRRVRPPAGAPQEKTEASASPPTPAPAPVETT